MVGRTDLAPESEKLTSCVPGPLSVRPPVSHPLSGFRRLPWHRPGGPPAGLRMGVAGSVRHGQVRRPESRPADLSACFRPSQWLPVEASGVPGISETWALTIFQPTGKRTQAWVWRPTSVLPG